MKADRSRDTFDRTKHYRRVLHQQGRIVLDSDDNEQVSIDLAAAETTMSDVIGITGVPETSLAPGYTGGFAIAIGSHSGISSSSSSSSSLASAAPASSSSSSSLSSSSSFDLTGNDLTISHGRIYVDGILVINDTDTTLFGQPFLPLDPGDLGPAGVTAAGVYAVYLDVWERVITAIDDPQIQEVALGGPDTSLRTQIVWQVRLGRIDTGALGNNPDCEKVLAPWGVDLNRGRLTAQPNSSSADPLPCALPPQSGFRSLENQLYRVEVHTAGGYGTATFKWSRENGSVVLGIVPMPGQTSTGTTTGSTLHVTSTGRDASLGVKHGDWVELIDDRMEFLRGHGELLQVDTADAGQMTITLLTPPSQPIDLSRHPKLRRWDQTQNADSNGIAILDGTPIDLENGIQVQFSNGQYHVGDYWMVPARTATTQQTVGTIEWPTDTGGNYLPQLPKGIIHHHCKLAIVAFDGISFRPPEGSAAVTDCRLFFPPLTSLATQDTVCTLTLHPEANWAAQLAALFPGNTAVDAEICFAVGQFNATKPAVIDTTGNVKVTGAGWGTKLVAQGLETVLRFRNCASVAVRDLSAAATRVGFPVDAASVHLGGTIEFENCEDITVEAVDLNCASAEASGAACLAVRNTINQANATTGKGTVSIRNTRCTVGELQYGMLLIHAASAVVQDNVFRRTTAKPPSFNVAIGNPKYRKLVERILIGGAIEKLPASSSSSSSATSSSIPGVRPAVRPALTRPLTRAPNTCVSLGSVSVHFQTPPQIRNVWQTFVDNSGQKEFASSADLLKFVKQSAANLLSDRALQQRFTGFGELVRFINRSQSTVARAAIVVGGQAIGSLSVKDNVIDGFLQGVVVGVSHHELPPPARPADTAGHIVIRDNRIDIVVDPILGHAAARFGIFAGNVESLQIENNRVDMTLPGGTDLDAEGIRVFGYLGDKMIVRHNHVSGFRTGIRVVQVAAPGSYDTVQGLPGEAYLSAIREGPLWLVADNVLQGTRQPIQANACLRLDNTVA
ncbi:MAG TPA: DUF6519 domain-containing protein [Rhodopila sp.]